MLQRGSDFGKRNRDMAAANEESEGSLSSSLTTLFRRADNRTLFARQGSDSGPSFMRQSSVIQAISPHQDRPVNRSGLENASRFSATPMFSRPSQRSALQEFEMSASPKNLPPRFHAFENEKFYDMREAPKFSRPARKDPHLFGGKEYQSGRQEHETSADDPPKFARSDRKSSEQNQPLLQKLVRSACTRRTAVAAGIRNHIPT